MRAFSRKNRQLERLRRGGNRRVAPIRFRLDAFYDRTNKTN